MKLFLIPIFLLTMALTAMGQHSVTINIEKLTPPSKKLWVNSYQEILEGLINADSGYNAPPSFNTDRPKPAYDIVAKSNITDSLVDFNYHPLFEGLYRAYADHRPFTLSPDMIWLLICQGFSQHVNNNSESLRNLFVDFKGKIGLVVRDDRIDLNDPNSPWPEVFPSFNKKISDNVGKQLTDILTADFSTTTLTSKIASQITLMDAFKSYFEFVLIYSSCGIPKVTLEGTQQDWQKVLMKTEALRKYKLDWWVDKLEPVLKKIVAASSGKVDTAFWRGMFKLHSGAPCQTPSIANGWIVKFFPYDKRGNRNNLDSIAMTDELPNEIVKVDLKYIMIDSQGNNKTIPLELWAGFVGLNQNNKTFELKPEIGWMVRKKTVISGELLSELKKKNSRDSLSTDGDSDGIKIRVKTIPDELMQIGAIHSLTIYFTDDINIPDELGKVKIDKFTIFGKISEDGEKRIRKMFPDAEILINPY